MKKAGRIHDRLFGKMTPDQCAGLMLVFRPGGVADF